MRKQQTIERKLWEKQQLKESYGIGAHIIKVVFIIMVLVYWSLIAYRLPLNVSPDELLRYKLPLFLYHNGYFPSGFDPKVMLPYGNYSYAFYPQWLGPLLSALFMKVISIFSTQPRALLFAARWTSVFFGTVTVLCVGMSAEKLYHRRWLTVFAVVLVAFLPQFVYLSVYVNNDVIAIAGVSIVMYALVCATVDRWDYRNALIFGVGSVVALLGYLNAVVFVIIGAIYAVTLIFIQIKADKVSSSMAIKCIILSLAIIIVVCTPFFFRNYIIYHDLLGNHIFEERYRSWIRHGGQPTMFPFQGSWRQLLFNSKWFEWTLKSTVGLFGYMNVEMKQSIYLGYKIFFSIGTILFIFAFLYQSKLIRVLYLTMLIATILTVLLSLYRTKTLDFQAQGRYIMTSIPTLALMFTTGYSGIPKIIQKWTVYIVTIGYVILGIILTYHYIWLRLC